MKPSIKVGLTAAAVIAAAFGGNYAIGEFQLRNFNPDPILPSRVTLVAVDTDLGFSIRVANSVAHLIQVDQSGGGFESPQKSENGEDARRIPIKELLETLTGDEESLVRLVAVLNKMDPDDLEPGLNEWPAADIRKALDGDEALRSRLEQDLNVKLDGTPLETVRVSSILNGIRILVPIPVNATVGAEQKTLVAQLPIRFQAGFTKEVATIIEKRFNPTDAFIAGNYRDVAKRYFENPASREDIAARLEKLIAEDLKSFYAARPEQVLQGSSVLVNENQLESASTSVRKDEKGREIFTIHLKMTEEGRKRLWKYSRARKGSSLLVVVNGVAIAAPKITTELSGRQLDLTDLNDKRLVDEAVKEINDLKTQR